MNKIDELLNSVKGKKLTPDARIEKSIALAGLVLESALAEKRRGEKGQETKMMRMMKDPRGRIFITTMTDQCFRSHSSQRVADQLIYLLKKFGIPQFLSESDRMKFLFFRLFGNKIPQLFVPIIRKQIQHELAHVLLPETPRAREAYFQKCQRNNIRVNLNHLGEAILGEIEANRRFEIYLQDLLNPKIEYISIKISTIYSQINQIGYHASLTMLASRLRTLYRSAKANFFNRGDGTKIRKFVNLDMEEFRDLDLTVDLFQKVLNEPEFFDLQAGIVLQSYLPNSFTILQALTEWARERVKKGGAPIKLRLVKGANLAMESVESSIRGWDLPTFAEKIDTDGNFKRMLEYACQIENAKAVHIGVGSHNLFDIAFALILRAETQTEDYISFEMLEGMALPMQRAIKKITKTLLLYCPEAHRRDFHNAVAYLIRRLDENCGPENFLRHFYEIRPGNKSFQEEAQKFSASYRKFSSLPSEGMRRQNRRMAPAKPADETPFHNEPDTDFSLAENRKWAEEIFKEWEFKEVPRVPLMIAGEEMPGEIGEGFDPSRPATPRFLYTLADISSAQKAIDAAVTFTENWSKGVFEERFLLLGKVAQGFREQRKDLIGVMIANGGKTIWEADPEVSEAIDFIEYYRRNWKEILAMKDLTWREKGVVLVAPPWNFPCSIPVSGIAAALTAGNCVLFKPAPEAILIGWHVAKIFWDAGVPKEALQFIVCKDDPVGSYLVKHPAIASIILTGGTATAKTFLNLRPGLDLHAEAGGKNAMIVTAMADRDLAVRDIIHSAFSHAGQKCSACSLLILEREVYDDPQFKKQLLDAAQSLVVDSAWNPHARITPLIREPEGNLLRAITQLEEGESWLLKPQIQPSNRQLLSPGIKWGVEKNSFTHLTELFGPILGVMRAASLDEAIALANATPYGLTSGLHSLDEREQLYWKERIVAGNLYINRTITGAIVRRQPFGGCKLSNFGSGAKAGGPNYVAQTAIAKQIAEPAIKGVVPSILVELLSKVSLFKLLPEEENLLKKSIENYSYWAPILKKPIDLSLLRGEDNEFYLVPRENYFLRIEEKPSTLLPLLQIIAASLICQTHLIISAPFPMEDLKQVAGISVVVEEEEQFLKRQPSRIRLLHPPSASLKQGAASVGATFQKELPLINGRIELLHYMREVSLSMDYHRYGYLGLREEI